MLLLNDTTKLQEVKYPSSLNRTYIWSLLPYHNGNDSQDVLLMLVYHPPKTAFPVAYGFNLNWPMVGQSEAQPETIECISLSRAGRRWMEEIAPRQDFTVGEFVQWLIACMVVRLKGRLLDVDIEDDALYPFLRGFVEAHSQDQGLHAIANTLTNTFGDFYSFSSTH